MKTIVLTGASGFIGNQLLHDLIKLKKYKIVVLSRKKINKKKIINLKFDINKNFDYSLIKNSDILIHLAWGNLNDFNSIKHLNSELDIQKKFIDNILKSNIKTIFVSGTCLEYGNREGRLSEKFKSNPITNYALSKNKLREYIVTKNYKINLIWGRIFYIYGNKQKNESLFFKLKNEVKLKKQFFNMSQGTQSRDYLEITQLSKIIINLTILEKNIGIINICSGKSIKIKNLVKYWIKKNNWKIKMNLGFYQMPIYEAFNFWGSDKKLKKFLNK